MALADGLAPAATAATMAPRVLSCSRLERGPSLTTPATRSASGQPCARAIAKSARGCCRRACWRGCRWAAASRGTSLMDWHDCAHGDDRSTRESGASKGCSQSTRARAWQLGCLMASSSCEGGGARQMRKEAGAHRLMIERHGLGEKDEGHDARGQLDVASWMLQTCEAKEHKESAAGRSRAQTSKGRASA